MIQLVKSAMDPVWMEVQENGIVLQEIAVHFRLWKIPKSFGSVEEVVEWLAKTEKKQAKNRAYRLLSGRSYPSSLLLKKLLECGYSQTVCQEIVDELQSIGYVQDQEFWAGFIRREFQKGNGPRLIALKGKMKGMPAHLVRSEITDDMQREMIAKNQKKGFERLMRKGFDSELLVEFFRR